MKEADEGRKRRLPLWMVNVSTDDQVSISRHENNSCKEPEEEPGSQATQSVAKVRSTRHNGALLHRMEKSSANLSRVGKCDAKTRKISSKRQKQDHDIVDGTVSRKKLIYTEEVQETFSQKQPQGSSEESETSSLNEVAGELTVEDLVSIAEEYVKTHDSVGQPQKQPEREYLMASQRQNVNFFADASEGSHDAVNILKESAHETMILGNSVGCSTSNEIARNSIARYGDPAQGMLDLFLGPLLKKPPEEKQTEFRLEEWTCDDGPENKGHNIGFGEPLPKRSCDDGPGSRSDNSGFGEPLLSGKKKISLKDKVAIFLD